MAGRRAAAEADRSWGTRCTLAEGDDTANTDADADADAQVRLGVGAINSSVESRLLVLVLIDDHDTYTLKA